MSTDTEISTTLLTTQAVLDALDNLTPGSVDQSELDAIQGSYIMQGQTIAAITADVSQQSGDLTPGRGNEVRGMGVTVGDSNMANNCVVMGLGNRGYQCNIFGRYNNVAAADGFAAGVGIVLGDADHPEQGSFDNPMAFGWGGRASQCNSLFAHGNKWHCRIENFRVHGGGSLSHPGDDPREESCGDQQICEGVMRARTVGAETKLLSSAWDAVARHNTVYFLRDGQTAFIEGETIGIIVNADGVAPSVWKWSAVAHRGVGPASITVAVTQLDRVSGGYGSLYLGPNPDLGALDIIATGDASVAMDWVSRVRGVEHRNG